MACKGSRVQVLLARCDVAPQFSNKRGVVDLAVDVLGCVAVVYALHRMGGCYGCQGFQARLGV
jgi:hypothetical protein